MADDDLKRLLETMRQESAEAQARAEKRLDGVENRFDLLVESIAAAHAETRRHFDVAIERIDKRIDLLVDVDRLEGSTR